MQTQSKPKLKPIRKPVSLSQVLTENKEKIRADLFRFRTCCADPRASK